MGLEGGTGKSESWNSTRIPGRAFYRAKHQAVGENKDQKLDGK